MASAAEIERSTSAREAADRRDAGERAAQRANAGAQQLRLAAEALQPAGGALARGLDALEALLAALADRDQLGLDLAAALDRQADRVGLRASGHDSVRVIIFGACESGWCGPSRGQDAASGLGFDADQRRPGLNGRG